jgi:hypothetical protein
MIGVFSRWRLEELRWEPENPLGLVGGHQLFDQRLEVREHLDL